MSQVNAVTSSHISSLPNEENEQTIDDKVQEICHACLLKKEDTTPSYYRPSKPFSRLLDLYEQNPFEAREEDSYTWTCCNDGMKIIHDELGLISQDFLEHLFDDTLRLDDDYCDDVIYESYTEDGWTIDCGDYYFKVPYDEKTYNMEKQVKYSVYHALICLLHDSIKHRMFYEKKLLENGQCENIEWSRHFIYKKGPKILQRLKAFDEQLGDTFIKAYNKFLEDYILSVAEQIYDETTEKPRYRMQFAVILSDAEREVMAAAYKVRKEAREKAKCLILENIDVSDCLSLLWERGFLFFKKKDFFNALKNIELIIEHKKEQLNGPFLCSQCRSGFQPNALSEYQNTINALSQEIEQNPEDKEAFFQKALTNLETNSPETSLTDPLVLKIAKTGAGIWFGGAKGAFLGPMAGIKEEGINLLYSVQDIANLVSSLAIHPIDTLQSGWKTVKGVQEYLNTHSWTEIAQDYSPELKKLTTEWDQLTSQEVAQTICFMGAKETTKLAINLLAFTYVAKGITLFRATKAANNIGKIYKIKRFQKAMASAMKLDGVTLEAIELSKIKPDQTHHFATNKHKYYTKKTNEVIQEFGLDLERSWNKEMMEHMGRHPNAYHEFVLEEVKAAAKEAKGDVNKFLELFEEKVKKPVRENPELLTKKGWPDV